MSPLLEKIAAIRRISKLDKLVVVVFVAALIGQLFTVVRYKDRKLRQVLIHIPVFSVSNPMAAARRRTEMFHVGIQSHGKLRWHKVGRKEAHRVSYSHRLFLNLLTHSHSRNAKARTALRIGFCNRGPFAIGLGYEDPIDAVTLLREGMTIRKFTAETVALHTRVECDER